jgi:hypothetical protein
MCAFPSASGMIHIHAGGGDILYPPSFRSGYGIQVRHGEFCGRFDDVLQEYCPGV